MPKIKVIGQTVQTDGQTLPNVLSPLLRTIKMRNSADPQTISLPESRGSSQNMLLATQQSQIGQFF